MTTRDPRIDPRRGDVVDLPRFAGGCRAHVVRVSRETGRISVRLEAYDPRVTLRGRSWALATWQGTMADARVLESSNG